MKFRLDPPSGPSDSYLDVRFIVDFEHSDRAEVRLFNENLKQPLEILAVSQGFIMDGNVAVIKNSNYIEGFINIFNRDKMNSILKDHYSVDIRCDLSLYVNKELKSFSFVETFYNESKSLDSSVLPFDLYIHNPQIELSTNEPLKMSIISTVEKFYELCFMNEKSSKSCTFEIFAKEGKTDFVVPSEVLFSDLEIPSSMKGSSSFDLFWTKFEGVDYSKFANRKRIRVPGSRITLNGSSMMPQAQDRFGPIDELSEDFVLSDRYFVHTHKDFSEFGSKDFDSIRMKRLTFFYYEVLDMNTNKNQGDVDSKKLKSLISQDVMKNSTENRIKTFSVPKQKKFLSNFSPVFEKRANIVTDSSNLPKQQAEKPKRSGGCAGCSRKK